VDSLSEEIPNFLSAGVITHEIGCCAICKLKTAKTLLDGYEYFWDALPETLGMPPWDILETKKSEDTGADLIMVGFSFLLTLAYGFRCSFSHVDRVGFGICKLTNTCWVVRVLISYK